MSRPAPPLPFKQAVGDRLRRYFEELGISEAKLSERLGIGQSKFSQWCTGRNLPDVVFMVRLKREYGLSLDYLYADDLSNLPGHLVQRLSAPRAKGLPRPFKKA